MAETSIYIDEHLIGEVDEIAHARSSPGNHVSRSEVVREAIRAYVDGRRIGDDSDDNGDSVAGATAQN